MKSFRYPWRIAVLFCLSLSLATFAQMTPSAAVKKQISTVTRQVAAFSDLEKEFAAALQKRDQARLDAMLADDFDFWSPAGGGDPIDHDEWLENAHTVYEVQAWSIRELNVRMAGDTAVVSFTESEKSRFKGRSASGDYFVVDVWAKSADGWQLAARYASRLQKLSPAKSKPSGKR